MIEHPEQFIEAFAKAGASLIEVQVEATTSLYRTVQAIKELGADAGVAINPATSVEMLREILPYIVLVNVMTVEPGFGGQNFIVHSPDKIRRLRAMAPDVQIEVDGGIDRSRRILSGLWTMKFWPPKPGSTVITLTRTMYGRISRNISTDVAGLMATPASSPSSLIACTVRYSDVVASTWTSMRLAPAFAKASMNCSGCSIIRWASIGRSVTLRTASTTSGPKVKLGTKWPSMMSTWMRSAPAATASRT